MLVKNITYTDYDGNERSEDFYFNLSQAEMMEMELSTSGGLQKMLQKIVTELDGPKMVEFFKRFILSSYGEKTLDGKRFVKNEELKKAFEQTEAYSSLFMELITNADAASAFITAVIPKAMRDAAESENKNNTAMSS